MHAARIGVFPRHAEVTYIIQILRIKGRINALNGCLREIGELGAALRHLFQGGFDSGLFPAFVLAA
jgi:hypothetical protein